MALPNPKWIAAGKQVILKSDFIEIEGAILGQPLVRLQPSLVWVNARTVRVEATADCPASTAMTGMPNILNPNCQVNGGLSDGAIRENTSNVSMDMASGGIWGTEKASQWYAVFALAANNDTTFTLKGMPIMRVKSQAGQVLSTGTLITPATGIGYGFTTDELIDGIVYFVSGASRGLMRAITANNNNNATGGTIAYGGAALSVAAGDWFIVLPPAINFRWVGSVFNNASSNIFNFVRQGNKVIWQEAVTSPDFTGGSPYSLVERIGLCCPFACEARITPNITSLPDWNRADYPGVDRYSFGNPRSEASTSIEFSVNLCKCYLYTGADTVPFAVSYSYPAGTGF